jgi:hypothetical protein
LRARASCHHASVGEHDRQSEHVLAHGAVQHRCRPRGASRRHAADRRVGSGIDREHQAGVAERLRELQAGDASLDGGVEIFGADAQDAIHPAHVDRDATMQRVHVAFQRAAGAERNDGDLTALADADDVDDFGG